MPKITKVYTRTGDDGSTALGSGQRVPKSAPRIEACGAVDELNARIGVVLAGLAAQHEFVAPLRRMQNELFHLGADLCVPEKDKDGSTGPCVTAEHVTALEQLMDRISTRLEPLANFVLPGGSPTAAQLHVARTICRQAERRVVSLAEAEPVGPQVVQYLNRLSDVLFVLSRLENKQAGIAEGLWDSHA